LTEKFQGIGGLGSDLNGMAYADWLKNVARMEAEGRNPGALFETGSPDFASLHPGYMGLVILVRCR
jgi:hypothetical protein